MKVDTILGFIILLILFILLYFWQPPCDCRLGGCESYNNTKIIHTNHTPEIAYSIILNENKRYISEDLIEFFTILEKKENYKKRGEK